MNTLEDWHESTKRGTSGEMVYDILEDWEKERDQQQRELAGIIDLNLEANKHLDQQRQEIEALGKALNQYGTHFRSCLAIGKCGCGLNPTITAPNYKAELEEARQEIEALRNALNAVTSAETREEIATANHLIDVVLEGNTYRNAGLSKDQRAHFLTENASLSAQVELMRAQLKMMFDKHGGSKLTFGQCKYVNYALSTPPNDALRQWAKPLVEALNKFASETNWRCLNGASCWWTTQELPHEIAKSALAAAGEP